jgi:glucose/arabinose dehydrogenase
VIVSGCASEAPMPGGQVPELGVERLFPDADLELDGLVHLAWPDDGGDSLYAVLQKGEVWRITPGPSPSATATGTLYLDITDRVRTTANEEGVLGLAFDPDFPSNGHLFIYYSASGPRRSIISRFSGTADRANPASETLVLEVPQPFGNHNGGHIEFGPDGMLYLRLGDGGSGGDPQGNGQNPGTLLGSILRLDVSEVSESVGYLVPADNPFVGKTGARSEIWAYGLRNPWRFAFDPETGRLWAGDVGQNRTEEIDIITRGANYGWNAMEGSGCFKGSACSRTGLVLPVAEYGRDSGCSVTGGPVYRGSRLASLEGIYVYGDFCSGIIWGLRYEDGRVTKNGIVVHRGLVSDISSFAVDRTGEVLILSLPGGIYRFREK